MQHRKFLFDLSFDAADETGDARGPAAPRPAGPDPAAVEAALAEARAEAYREGRADALAEAEARAAATDAALFAAIADGIGRLLGQAAAVEQERARDAARLALSIARRMVPVLVEKAGFAEIEAIVTECLRRAVDEPRIVLRVAEQVFDMARGRVEPLARDAGFAGRVIVLADAQLAAADCRVEWADGGTERDGARLWRDIEGAVSATLAALEAQPAADAA